MLRVQDVEGSDPIAHDRKSQSPYTNLLVSEYPRRRMEGWKEKEVVCAREDQSGFVPQEVECI